jgi:hypothetical protein
MNPLIALAELGIAFSITDAPAESGLSLEALIVAGMPLVKTDLKAIKLLFTWLEANGDLLNEQVLISALNKTGTKVDRAILAGLLSKLPLAQRFANFIAATEKVSDSAQEIGPRLSRHISQGVCMPDPSLLKFGLMISEINLLDMKKLRSRSYVMARAERVKR